MLVKEATYKNVMVEQRRIVTPAVYGCDCCKKELKEYPNETNRLEVKVFKTGDEETKYLHFCSWKCVLKTLPKIKTNYFVDLPFMYYDGKRKSGDRSAKELVDLIKKLKL